MQITIIKGERGDRIEARRADGSHVATTFPHKGPIPHDAVHFFVESQLGLANGFWGLVAGGQHPEAVQELAKAGGHASASRAADPAPEIVEVIQAERAVECFEADLWGGSQSDSETFRGAMAAACVQSRVPVLELSDEAIAIIREKLLDLRSRWSALGQGESITLEWAVANG